MADEKKQPHNLFLIEEVGRGGEDKFHEIGVAWPTKDGKGFTFDIPPGMFITGRVAILPRKPKPAAE